MSSMGSRVRSVRVAIGFTQTELAHALKVTQGTVSDWETDKTAPNRGMLRLVADLVRDSERVFRWLESGRDPPALTPR